ncbi:hypothetical protein BU16DRAFT_61800 [Lophium mytilinum]|uniref:DUF6536 domain-containing protein n=1 Tax=Lophium mytilinum TaxID=390894 RepID=A0A6A6QNR0_9PEZI|nr:hypothetical protein BU16DRAFT_61800 [Lophium mytilinum]
MAGAYSYDSLPPLYESQDLADGREYSLDLASTLYSPDPRQSGSDSPLSKNVDVKDGASIHSTSTGYSTSSSSFEKLKHGLGLKSLRRKAVGSWRLSKTKRACETEYVRVGKGWWQDQLLSDRSIRGMAALTAMFAIAMIVIMATNAGAFRNRPNRNSTSVGGNEQSCKSVQRTNSALLIIINIAATMVLGMSNTYQQMVTSLKVGDIKYVLSKYGDTRVGTNSPFAINHKREGKLNAWLAWLLLICTSLPVHFLANSLIGPSLVFTPPKAVEYNATTITGYRSYSYSDNSITAENSFLCWSALRTGISRFPADSYGRLGLFDQMDDSSYYSSSATNYGRIVVAYDKGNCSSLVNNTNVIQAQSEYNRTLEYTQFEVGSCLLGTNVFCDLHEPSTGACRLNIRMQAAFILGGCLVIKAIYMIAVNLIARGKVKRQCLTFGDVIVASASDPELRVKDECMVNAAESYRRYILPQHYSPAQNWTTY